MKPSDLVKNGGSEYQHQCALFARCALNVGKYKELAWFHSIQNEETSGSAIRGARGKASGKRKGVSDMSLPVKRGPYSGFYLELKKPGGKPSKEQLEFGKFVTEQGFMFAVVVGHEEAWAAIQWYLELK